MRLVETFERVRRLYGYKRIEVPVIEPTAVFARSLGETTDVVSKEMYTFEDKGGRSLSLRPEGTAGVVRAYIENGMASLPSPVRTINCGWSACVDRLTGCTSIRKSADPAGAADDGAVLSTFTIRSSSDPSLRTSTFQQGSNGYLGAVDTQLAQALGQPRAVRAVASASVAAAQAPAREDAGAAMTNAMGR